MYCSKCGALMADGAVFCSACGQTFSSGVVIARSPMSAQTAPAAARVEYGGFWLRFLAYLIDGAVITIGAFVIAIPLVFLTGLGTLLSQIHPGEDLNDAGFWLIMRVLFLFATFSLAVTWLYHALMESSEWQEGPRPCGDGHGGPSREFLARHGQTLRQNRVEHDLPFRPYYGRLRDAKAGAARYDCRLPDLAPRQLALNKRKKGRPRSFTRSPSRFA